MSRFLARAATVAAAVSIVLLVVLLVILWTGVKPGSTYASLKSNENENQNENQNTYIDNNDNNNDNNINNLTSRYSEKQRGTYNENKIMKKLNNVNSEVEPRPFMMIDRVPHRFNVNVQRGKHEGAEEAGGNLLENRNLDDNVLGGSKSTKDIDGRDDFVDHGGTEEPDDDFDEQFKNNFDNDDRSGTKENIEHISPKKIYKNIYEDPAVGVTATRHHTGHFRHSAAEVWDPHPQYEFDAFGKKFHILLSQDTSFISPHVKVTHVGENSTRRENLGQQIGCFYSGTVKGDPKSVVSVSLCHGMSGHIRTSTGSYFIEPADRNMIEYDESEEEGQGSVDEPILHVIYLASATRSNANSVRLPDEKNGGNGCVLVDTIDGDEEPTLLIDDGYPGSAIDAVKHDRERRSIAKKNSIDDNNKNNNNDSYNYEKNDGEDDDEEFRINATREFVGSYGRSRFSERSNYGRLPNERREFAVRRRHIPDERGDSYFNNWRPRRALPQEYFIEIMIVADAKMAEYHGRGLNNYVLVLMSTVSRIYKDPSIGNPISIAVVKIATAAASFSTKYHDNAGIAADEMLKKFCLWQKHQNVADESSPIHHDAALLLTRENLCHNPREKQCDTLGLAELGRMCVPRSSCAIVQDNGLAAAFTIAHEIGHVLSMPHDDDPKCRQYTGNNRLNNVMSRVLDANTFPWEWSNCSRHYVTEFLDSGYGNCLLDEPNANEADAHHVRLPGENYSRDEQCELVYGSGSRICPYMVVCRILWCTAPVWDKDEGCHTQHMPWADGTACGHGKWCDRGECVSRKIHRPIDGQWGPWQNYGECSRTCGGGIKKKYRECNDPAPQHGGKYCTGTRVKYLSCKTKDCPSDSEDFREQQCSSFNNNNMNIKNLHRDVVWHAKYTLIQPTDRCKLYCQVESNQYYMLKDKVIDGTPCSIDTFDICVNGLCKAAGCDHELNSTGQLDTCGVCRGDNSSCQRITGSYNVSMYGYNRIAKIPAGSSYIDIRQHGWQGENDSNYLAVRNKEGGKYILNGNSMIAHSKQLREPGISLDYTGPEFPVERLNGSRPIKSDLILEVLSVGNLSPPQIFYEYTVPKNILTSYTWVLSDWSTCTRVCQGVRYRIAECRSAKHKEVVSHDYCKAEDKPREESQICNMHCSVSWNVVSKSECSSHCGPGTRVVTSQCIYRHSTTSQPISEHACRHLDRPAEREVCVGPCDESHWFYGDWGACSATCKGGIQMRTAACVDSNGKSVSEAKCNAQEKVVKRICEQGPCPRWTLGHWTPCSVTCGVGMKRQAVWCQLESRIVPPIYCKDSAPAPTETCDMGLCPGWHSGEWSSCSASCGKGVERREIVCKIPNTLSPLDKTYCNNTEPPPTTRVCAHQPCHPQTVTSTTTSYPVEHDNEVDHVQLAYRWRTGTFGECSKSCDTGYKKRVVKCSSAQTGNILDDQYCDPSQKPQEIKACNQHACARWNTGDWSQCDSECGPGYKHRQVHCRTERGEILPDNDCSATEKPRHVERCANAACVTVEVLPRSSRTQTVDEKRVVKWRMSRWTPCSKSCGDGTKSRRVDCVANSGTGDVTEVNERECLALVRRRPKSQRPCNRMPCDLSWQEGTWSECSAECGNGVQIRSVTCHRVNRYGWTDPMTVNDCRTSEKPPHEQKCKLKECDDEYSWGVGQWKKCSAPCGKKGKQMRRIFCSHKSGKKVAKKFCPIKFRPQHRRKCNQHRCGLQSCAEVKKRYKTTKDAEYSMLIGGKSMSIYCHNMTGDNPTEYLTLPTGDRENFAEIYDKSLLDPNTCPFNGQRNENCHCVSNGGSRSGRTMFRRVRLDPATLVVAVDDFTFSWTRGSKRVKFGEAGDCYSRLKCPQGQFSINLEGTQLRLSTELSWIDEGSTTSNVINKINQQKVVGKCGGYCGYCKLERGLKLDVLPP